MKLHHWLGAAEAKHGHVGMELEVEALNELPVVNEKSWKSKPDGSLRGFGMEYVNKGPILVDERKPERLKYLCDKINAANVIKDSPRTSFHVHVNVSDLEPTQIWTAVTAYFLLENLLMKHCGPDREGNLFCLRLADAESIIPAINKDLRYANDPFRSFGDKYRYMALNLKAVRQFGSLEFRGMRGSTDAELLDSWSNNVWNLVRRSSERWQTPALLMDAYYNGNTVLDHIVDADFARTLKADNPDWADLIDENAGAVCEFAYAVSWDKYSEGNQIRPAKKLRDDKFFNIIFDEVADAPPVALDEEEPVRW